MAYSTPRKPRRGGYVLVMTLVIIGIAVATMARLASYSVSLAHRARQSSVELQEKWAGLSGRLRLLEPAELVLGDLAAKREAAGLSWPHPALLRGEYELAGVPFEFCIADEQAKLNLNRLQAERPDLTPSTLGMAARQRLLSLPIRLRPLPLTGSPASHRYFDNWGRVIDLAALASDPDAADGLLGLAEEFTCWGDGRVNITRISDAALMPLLRFDLNASEAQLLLDARRGYAGELGDLLDSLDIPGRKRTVLRRRLTDRSSCYSLWLVESARAGDRLSLTIDGGARTGQLTRQTFRWP